MGTKRKRRIHDDATPTIFCFSKVKKKRESSEKRSENAAKEQVSAANKFWCAQYAVLCDPGDFISMLFSTE